MIRLRAHFFSLLLLAGLLVPAAFAAKEDPHETLNKSFQQADLWTQGPVKLSVKLTMPHVKPDGSDVVVDYTLSWASPEKWRAEWSSNGPVVVTILNNGKLSYMNSQANPVVQLLQFEAAVAAVDGADPAGPYTVPPVPLDSKTKIDTTKKKVNNIDAHCLAFGDPLQTYCIDPATGHVLSVSMSIKGVEFGAFEYSDYTTSGNVQYPQTIKVTYAGKLLEEGKITISREPLPDATFIVPDKSTTIDFKSCADVAKNFTAPKLTKSAPPKMPEAAAKAKKYGLVWVFATVGKDGSVTKATMIGGDPDLSIAATDAVKQYKYSPYMRCGEAVEFTRLIAVPFVPPQKAAEEPSPTK